MTQDCKVNTIIKWVVKRMNKTLMDKVRCMLVQAKRPIRLWAEMLNTTCYLVNPLLEK